MTQKTPPIGMVDDLEPTPRARTPFELAVLEYVLSNGPVDTSLLGRVMDPAGREAYAKAEMQQRVVDWPFLGLYRGDNATVQEQQKPRVVFLGDSLTEIWQHGDPALFSNGVIGRGIGGQTSPQILLRFYPDVVALKPAAVHILCGSNDIAGNTGPTTPQDYKNNIMAMLDIAKVNGIKVLLGSLTPSAGFLHRPEVDPIPRIAEINEWLRQITNERGATYIDYFTPLVAEDGSLPAKYTNDGLHPNRAGYDVMRPLVVAAIDKILSAV